MAEQKASVGIGVEARVDGSVTRAFQQLEQQNKRLGRDNQRLKRETGAVGRESRRAGHAVGVFSRGLNAAGKRVRQYTHNIGAAVRNNQLMRKSLSKMGSGLDALGNKWTGLATGAAGAGSAAAVMSLQERYERLGIQAGKSSQEMASLRKEMFATSQQSDIRVDQGEMLSAVEKIVEKTGDLKFARENMANIGRVMQATGAAGADVGEMFADMSQKFGLKNNKDVLAAIDTLVVQGKAGAFTLQNIAAEGAAVSAAYAAMGRTGPKAVQEMGALLQMSRMGSGSAAEAASSMESVLEDITSNYKDIEKLGIEVFDEAALERGEKKFRAIPAILKDIMKATDGDITEYSKYFGDEAMRTLKVLAGEDGKKLDSFLAVQGDGTAVIQDSARAAKTATAAMQSLKTAWLSFADQNLSKPISALADAINSINPETLNSALTGATVLAGTMGAAWAGRKVWKTGQSIAGFFRGGRHPGNGSSPLAGMDGVTKVFVTNMPGGGFGGDDFSAETDRKRGKRRRGRSRFRRGRGLGRKGLGGWLEKSGRRMKGLFRLGRRSGVMKTLTRKIPYVGAALGALDIGSTLMDNSLTRQQKSKEVGGSVGNLGGMAAGAAIGTMIFPGVGTAIGGLIGGLGGEALGRWLGGWLSKNEQKKPQPGQTITTHHHQSEEHHHRSEHTHYSEIHQPQTWQTLNNHREAHYNQVDLSRHVTTHDSKARPLNIQVPTQPVKVELPDVKNRPGDVIHNQQISQARYSEIHQPQTWQTLNNHREAYYNHVDQSRHLTTHDPKAPPLNIQVQAQRVKVEMPDAPKRPGDVIHHQSVSHAHHAVSNQTHEIHRVNNQIQNQQQASMQVNFSPVFHVQGHVDDQQIEKLEKMVMKVARQIEKLKITPRNVRFADG